MVNIYNTLFHQSPQSSRKLTKRVLTAAWGMTKGGVHHRILSVSFDYVDQHWAVASCRRPQSNREKKTTNRSSVLFTWMNESFLLWKFSATVLAKLWALIHCTHAEIFGSVHTGNAVRFFLNELTFGLFSHEDRYFDSLCVRSGAETFWSTASRPCSEDSFFAKQDFFHYDSLASLDTQTFSGIYANAPLSFFLLQKKKQKTPLQLPASSSILALLVLTHEKRFSLGLRCVEDRDWTGSILLPRVPASNNPTRGTGTRHPNMVYEGCPQICGFCPERTMFGCI